MHGPRIAIDECGHRLDRNAGESGLRPCFFTQSFQLSARVTTLYGIIHGKPPAFFDGNAKTFTGLQFHLLID